MAPLPTNPATGSPWTRFWDIDELNTSMSLTMFSIPEVAIRQLLQAVGGSITITQAEALADFRDKDKPRVRIYEIQDALDKTITIRLEEPDDKGSV